MTYAYGLPSDPRPYSGRHDRATRRPQPGSALGLAALATGATALLSGFLPLASWTAALLPIISAALGFAALGRTHRARPRDGGSGWRGLILELAAGAMVIWLAVVLLTVLVVLVTSGGHVAGGDGPGVRERIGGAGPVLSCLLDREGQLTCEDGAVQVLQ
ncbi:hypothetical protein ACFFMN_09490 [Planobispora siamensis]|uniref:DUF4190 domain-containing protein n=1 Tax=Planobispora siamensis TaxID=936338 RepID=A0A8J3WJ76_9ACTN|nr:hypothetical protein [Planobispora siamensis]GIH91220.1 hypothetical protein Psi01_18500 [Planobispora siamensis]